MKTRRIQENGALRRFGALLLAVIAVALTADGAAQNPIPGPEPIPAPDEQRTHGPPQCPTRDIVAGVADRFETTDGVEAAAPSETLKAWIGPPFAPFDEEALDRRFVHTFRLPPCKCLVGARLEVLAEALGTDGKSSSGNDILTLGFATLPGQPRWSAYLGGAAAPPAITTPAWGASPKTRLVTLDLAALPTPQGGTVSLLSAMQTNRYLDLYIQDDTGVDHAKLTVTMCDCCQAEGRAQICVTKFHDRNGNGRRERGEPGLAGWTFQANDHAGGNLVTSPRTDPEGRVCFPVSAPATYSIAEQHQGGWKQTTPKDPDDPVVTVSPGQKVELLFGNWREIVDPGPNDDTRPD